MTALGTTYALVREAAGRSPTAPAFIGVDQRSLSYGDLATFIDTTHAALNRIGVGRRDRVALLMPNGAPMAASFLALSAAAACAPLNPAYRTSEFEFFLDDLNARVLVILETMDSPCRDVAAKRGIPIVNLALDADGIRFELRGDGHAPVQDTLAEPGDVSLVLHTSGTTSRPKAVPLRHENLCASAEHIRTSLALTSADRCLDVMPLFHIHGIVGGLLSSLRAGASVICPPPFDPDAFFQWMSDGRPTWYTAVPTMHQAIAERAPAHRELISRTGMRLIRSSSASLPPTLMAQIEREFQAPVIESYGMTEAAHQMASNPLPPRARKPGSVGVAAGPEVVILDDAGQILPATQVGEVAIRGPNVMRGYDNNPKANESAFTNGYFRTGDQGYLDPEGYLFLTGRLKEIINRGGEKISPREVDERLLEHPAVASVVTFAVPHTTLGESVAAAVVLKAGARATEAELRAFAAAGLADFKVPQQVLLLDNIPKGPTGKLQRIGLADKLADKLQHKFVAPRTEVERQLAAIWQDVLKVPRVGVHDNFFSLGGDSLKATMIIAKTRAAGLTVDLSQMFQHATIDELVNPPAAANNSISEDVPPSTWRSVGVALVLTASLMIYLAIAFAAQP